MGLTLSIPDWWPFAIAGGVLSGVATAFMRCAIAELVIRVAARLYAPPTRRAAKTEEWLRHVRDMKPAERPAHADSLLWLGVATALARLPGRARAARPRLRLHFRTALIIAVYLLIIPIAPFAFALEALGLTGKRRPFPAGPPRYNLHPSLAMTADGLVVTDFGSAAAVSSLLLSPFAAEVDDALDAAYDIQPYRGLWVAHAGEEGHSGAVALKTNDLVLAHHRAARAAAEAALASNCLDEIWAV